MKLKLDENGNAVLENGMPVYVNDSGADFAFDGAKAFGKINELNAESKQHRQAKEAVQAQLKQFEGIDAEAARKALQGSDNNTDIDAIRKEVEAPYLQKIESSKTENARLNQALHNEIIGGSFARSQFIKENLAVPADMIQATFGKNFVVEDGKMVAKDSNGQTIFSQQPDQLGSAAGFDEAMSVLVNNYPHKDSILKSSGMSGSGEQGTQGGSSTLKRSQMTATEKREYAEANGGIEAVLALPK